MAHSTRTNNEFDPDYTYTPPTTTPNSPRLTGSANISIRSYIYFLPHPLPAHTPVPYTTGLPTTNPLNLPPHPFEPTNTLVLTSPGKTFVDLRYLKPVQDSESPLPNRGERERLEWGFAGTSTSTVSSAPPHETYGAISHSIWTHWIDSRFPAAHPDIPVDEGDMYDLGEGLTLEHGHAFHPHLGAVSGHEELWRDVDPVSTSGKGTKVCVVLRCVDEERGVRGVVVRVGRFCQGIVQVGMEVTTEKWEWEGRAGGAEGQEEMRWKRTARTGDGFLPCAVVFRPERVVLGGKVVYKGCEWSVEEVWEWE